MCRVLAVVSALLVGLAAPAVARPGLDNGLAAAPPTGWNDWNAFGCGVDQQLVEQAADALVSTGMRDAGYQYVNIDDCWALPDRDANGGLVADPAKFPDGVAKLADYTHARSLKPGIYEDSGTRTCSKSGGFPGSLGHEQQDADLFASWHVDYIEYDDCTVPADGQNVEATTARYDAMRDALAGKGIVFSICEKTDFGVPNSAWPTVVAGVTAPVWLRITRDGTAFAGQYSVDGTTWSTVATITVPSASGPEDVGVFTASHSKYVDGRADFGPLAVG